MVMGGPLADGRGRYDVTCPGQRGVSDDDGALNEGWWAGVATGKVPLHC